MRVALADVSVSQPARFVVNGLVATAVHFGLLWFCLEVLHLRWAGLANTLAAGAGIATSFIGSRHFVFRARREPLLGQLSRFWVLYVALALVQGAWLFFWTDLAGLDFRPGFLVGIAIQTVGAYYGGRQWVFSPRN